MPFNFQVYEQQCSGMNKVELLREIERQSDTIAAAGAGTGFAVLAMPLTMGLSAVAIGGTAPAIINARKKRQIARKYYESVSPPSSSPSRTEGVIGTSSLERRRDKSQQQQQPPPLYTPGPGYVDTREKHGYVSLVNEKEETVDTELPPPSYDETATVSTDWRQLRTGGWEEEP